MKHVNYRNSVRSKSKNSVRSKSNKVEGRSTTAEAEDEDARMAADDRKSEDVVSTIGSVVAAEAEDEDDDDEDMSDDDFGDSPFGQEDDEEEELDVNDNGATDFEDFSENELRWYMEALEYCEEHGLDPFTGNPIGEISAEEVNDTTRAFGEVDGTEYSYFQDIKSHSDNKHVGNQCMKRFKPFQPHPPKKS